MVGKTRVRTGEVCLRGKKSMCSQEKGHTGWPGTWSLQAEGLMVGRETVSRKGDGRSLRKEALSLRGERLLPRGRDLELGGRRSLVVTRSTDPAATR
jgi:hypothetical protein